MRKPAVTENVMLDCANSADQAWLARAGENRAPAQNCEMTRQERSLSISAAPDF